MVERDQHEPDNRLQHDGKATDEKVGHGLHHHENVEVTIEERAVAIVVKKRIYRVDGSERHLGNKPGVKLSTEQIHQIDAERVQQTGNQEQHEKRQRQHHQRRDQTRVGHGIDQHLDRNRRCQRQQADADPIDDGQRVVAFLGPENLSEKPGDVRQRMIAD